ncbi:MAG: chorismate synthase [Cyanobacteria bacterium]|nr:chorismate synthase [Cyanobacteriota bacterium]
MRFLTGGESHGKGLTVIVDGFPAGIAVLAEAINNHLARRQLGYGRGPRMKIEKDTVSILSGVRHGLSTGAPITLWIENKDFPAWEGVMSPEPIESLPDSSAAKAATDSKSYSRPRPGHADLAGYWKYNHRDLRDVLERASARETAARVAAGALAQCLLTPLGIRIHSHVIQMGSFTGKAAQASKHNWQELQWQDFVAQSDANPLRSLWDSAETQEVIAYIDTVHKAGDTLGGRIEVLAIGVPPGLGSYTQWDKRLDGQLAQALISIHAVKNVTLGDGTSPVSTQGSQYQDAIDVNPDDLAITRRSNHAGGIEGGMSNGMPILLQLEMKPLSTLRVPLDSVNLETMAPEPGHFERSDVTAVPACGVVAEAMTAWVLANAVLEKFGADCWEDLFASWQHYHTRLKRGAAKQT